jgi:alpha-galactosidase
MGWNTWNRFGPRIDERLIRESAEALVSSGMRDAGYRYVVIDDCWEAKERSADGDLVPDPDRFPSGLAALAEQVHALGLKLGIYTDVGTATCQGLPGSLGYEFRDARRFAEWGVDYVKVDWCNTEGVGPRAAYAKWAMALLATKRPMVLSVCEWGRSQPWEWAGSVGHLWRTCWDTADSWDSLMAIVDRQVSLAPYAGPDGWNDPDMLEVGNGGMSETEYRTHFALWAMLAAPLMAGNDLRDMSDATRAILTAPELIALDQDPLGKQGRRLRAEDGAEVWARDLADPRTVAVLLLNRGETTREISVSWPELGWAANERATVRDLWGRFDIGTARGEHVATADAHEALLLTLRR